MGGMPSSFDALPFLVPAYTLMPMLLPWAGCKLRCALVLDVDEEVEPVVNGQSIPMVRFFRLRLIQGLLMRCMVAAPVLPRPSFLRGCGGGGSGGVLLADGCPLVVATGIMVDRG